MSDSDGSRWKQSCCHWLLLRAETVRTLGVLARLPGRYSLVFVTDVTDRPEQGPAVCCETSAEWGIMNL